MKRSSVYSVEGPTGEAEVFELTADGLEEARMGFEVAFRRVVAPRCWDYVMDWQVIPDEPPRYLKAGGSLEEACRLAGELVGLPAESEKTALRATG